MRLKAYVPLRRLNVSRGGEGVDSTRTHRQYTRTHARKDIDITRSRREYHTRARRRYTNVAGGRNESLNRRVSPTIYPPFVYVLRLTYNSADVCGKDRRGERADF